MTTSAQSAALGGASHPQQSGAVRGKDRAKGYGRQHGAQGESVLRGALVYGFDAPYVGTALGEQAKSGSLSLCFCEAGVAAIVLGGLSCGDSELPNGRT